MHQNHKLMIGTHIHSLSELKAIYDKAYQSRLLADTSDPLYEPYYYFITQQGKRLRPLLLLAAADMFELDPMDAIGPAFGIELFHNFSLVHDDIMDEADLRRGRPTVHLKYGRDRAILAGDMMLIHVYRQMATAPPDRLPELLEVFNQTAIEVIEGQELDMAFEQRKSVTLKEYLRMIEYKTSVLLAAALRMGAILGGASEADRERLYDFGRNLGLAFQIKDDWLDAFGDGEKLGKKIGGDIIQNKKTCLWIKAWETADESTRGQLLQLENEADADEKVAKTLNIFDRLRVREAIEKLMTAHYQKGLASLSSVEVPKERKGPLTDLAEQIFLRDH